MSSSEALATVRKLFEAVAERDAAGYFAAYHPDSLISEAPSLPYGGDYSGAKGARQHAEAFRCTWDRYQPEDSRDLEPEFLAFGDRWSCCGGSGRRGREETASICRRSASTGCGTGRSSSRACSTSIPCSSIASSRASADGGEPGRRTEDGRQKTDEQIQTSISLRCFPMYRSVRSSGP
jgi:hypothetical protein